MSRRRSTRSSLGSARSIALVSALALAALTVPRVAVAQGIDLSRFQLVDLTHAFNAGTHYWPTAKSGFRLDTVSRGQTEGGWFYSAYAYSAPEHGGTHLDAPIHFSATGLTADRIPLEQLIAPVYVIDVSAKAALDPDYRLTMSDVIDFEKANGRIPRGAMVVLRTGWGAKWNDRKAYLGDDTPGDVNALHFPSFGEHAARLLVNDRKVLALGADVASIDYGQSTDFIVHQLSAKANVLGLENLTNLDRLPAKGATMIALPMKIEGGSGGPLRAIALIPRR